MNKDRLHLLHIQRNIAHIQRLTQDGKENFLANEDKQAAILYYLQTLSESTTHLRTELRNQHPEIAWQQIRAFRNRVVHDYLNVDLELVWLIIANELEALKKAITMILDNLPDEE